jgi:NAD(P)-dependent dehydrogenase (short-subunit alcohol dehydrogenase family)
MKTTLEFSGKTALITGASNGFGEATARMMAAQGAQIVAVDRNEERLQKMVGEWEAHGVTHHALVYDLRPSAVAQEVMGKARFLVQNLDILVNSAGVCHFNKAAQITPEEWDEVLEIDLRAIFLLSVAFAEGVDPQRGGRIINLGSNAGRKGRALSMHYAAAKAAVANLTESLALAMAEKTLRLIRFAPPWS